MDFSRKLPLGIQDFEYLRAHNYLYADKTPFLYYLVNVGKSYFLSRPRRFGKSLFLSTLKACFLGKKELFEGLQIYDLEDQWIEYPIIYLDFSKTFFGHAQNLYNIIDSLLVKYEEKANIKAVASEYSTRLENIIKKMKIQSGKNVVVLVDEYDRPLLDSIDNAALNSEVRNILKGFYGILKSNDAHLRFVFLKGNHF